MNPRRKIDWQRFCDDMLAHIELSGRKYTISDEIELVDVYPWYFPIYEGHKYSHELVRMLSADMLEIMQNRKHLRATIREQLLKIAHCAQLAYSALERYDDQSSLSWDGKDLEVAND